MNTPICMSEEYWANSQLSIVRHYGRIKFNNHEYVIVNKEGKDIFELSEEAEREGRAKAIEAGEPADLCRVDFVQYYRALGRDVFIQLLKENNDVTEEQLASIYESFIKLKKVYTYLEEKRFCKRHPKYNPDGIKNYFCDFIEVSQDFRDFMRW